MTCLHLINFALAIINNARKSQRKRRDLHIGKEVAKSASFPNVDFSHEKFVGLYDKTIRTKHSKFKTFYPINKRLENRQWKI